MKRLGFTGRTGRLLRLIMGAFWAGGIVVAHRDGQGIVGSDLPALLPLFRHESLVSGVGFLDSGEMAVITQEGSSFWDLDGRRIQKRSRTISPAGQRTRWSRVGWSVFLPSTPTSSGSVSSGTARISKH